MTQQPSKPGRTPDPLDFPFHRALGGATDTLKAGATFVNTNVETCVVKIAGAFRVRLRGKTSGAGGNGTLSFKYLRPAANRTTNAAITPVYDNTVEGPSVDVAVATGVEFAVTIEPVGEAELLVTFTATGTGAWDFFDGSQQ